MFQVYLIGLIDFVNLVTLPARMAALFEDAGVKPENLLRLLNFQQVMPQLKTKSIFLVV